MALLRHANGLQGCLLIGAHRKWATDYQTDANDPKRKWRVVDLLSKLLPRLV
jgi:hypothetical protein